MLTNKTFASLLGMIMTMAIISTASISPAIADVPGYWTTKSGKIWRNGFGQCWRTRDWKPEFAVAECEEGISMDSDKDGIPDDRDACPRSAPGVKVDARGCEVDSDGDGVVDSKDRCPGTPAGTAVDARGCKSADPDRDDSDGDGVVDGKDRCPSTARGVAVNADGCERDSDGDGVVDSRDRCPNTVSGARVNASGCEIDSDNDGIVDSRDKCAGTARGKKVDRQGCELEEVIVLKGVNFETSSDQLKGGSASVLDEMAETLKRYPEMVVEVAGYTDNRGAASFNRQLSQKRATSVANYLISKGVSASNLQAKGYGAESPIADNSTAAGRAKNRRVELHIIQQ